MNDKDDNWINKFGSMRINLKQFYVQYKNVALILDFFYSFKTSFQGFRSFDALGHGQRSYNTQN